ncbi:hypothetical protein GCM10012284_53980 [Mangrovihabitans endophyticus]|uniref:Uncharacterized protein n=1 Tax=Mangrovihabitans endophyticus TaxID=1751298 RepID=A0A8J3C598_9ACTN|nr:hypothetical protein GCM10012284_53980 [Mangrovihabitans endophyticus]
MSSGNALVATAGSSVDPWPRVWIAQGVESIYRRVNDGSLIEGSPGAVSAGLDALTKAAGFVVASVRRLVRDGIATLMSRLIVCAAQLQHEWYRLALVRIRESD